MCNPLIHIRYIFYLFELFRTNLQNLTINDILSKIFKFLFFSNNNNF